MRDIQEILTGLRGSPAILEGMIRDIPESQLHERRGDGFWTIAQHVSHLAEVQPMLLERLERMLREERPRFVPFFPDEATQAAPQPEMSVAEALRRLHVERARQLALLESLTDDDWRREAEHPEYARYGLHILARHMLMHEHWHMYRVEELWLTQDAYLTRLEG